MGKFWQSKRKYGTIDSPHSETLEKGVCTARKACIKKTQLFTYSHLQAIHVIRVEYPSSEQDPKASTQGLSQNIRKGVSRRETLALRGKRLKT
eukprot:6492141-Amphidinium_carterae.2